MNISMLLGYAEANEDTVVHPFDFFRPKSYLDLNL